MGSLSWVMMDGKVGWQDTQSSTGPHLRSQGNPRLRRNQVEGTYKGTSEPAQEDHWTTGGGPNR